MSIIYRYPTQAEVDWLRSEVRTQPPAITRSEFFKLAPAHQSAFARAGFVPTDDPEPEAAPLPSNGLLRSEWDRMSPVDKAAAVRNRTIVDR